MPETLTEDTVPTTEDVEARDESLVTETLVEEVSIDGMCGVY